MKKSISFNKYKNVLLKNDPSLRALFNRHKITHFEPQPQRSPFESLIRAIAHQQLHGKAAETILKRLIDLFPDKKFPTDEDIIKVSNLKLRQCGFSQNKIKALKDIADKTNLGIVPTKKQIVKLNNQQIIDRLTKIFGVGRWTVEMMLIFQLGRLDIWPKDDFGIQQGYRYWKKKRLPVKSKNLAGVDKKWSPYQTVVALHLWREADLRKNKT